MLMDPNKHPSFSMLLFEDGFMERLQMPAVFIKEHKKMLAKTCILKTNEGMLWEAKIVREKSNFFICEGDWPQFVVYQRLELGDMLLFFLLDKSTFLVLPFAQKSCRNLRGRQEFEELSSSSEDEKEEDIKPSRKLKESSDSEVRLDPSIGSKDGETHCHPHSGDRSNVEANNVFCMKNAPVLKMMRSLVAAFDTPERPTSAFFIFMEEFRKQFTKENPSNKSIAAIGKAGGDKWKQMSDADKAPYIEEEEKRKVVYEKSMKPYKRIVAALDFEEDESIFDESDDEDEDVKLSKLALFSSDAACVGVW